MKNRLFTLVLHFAFAALVQGASFRISEVAEAPGEGTSVMPYTSNGRTENLNVLDRAIVTEKDVEKAFPYQDANGYGVMMIFTVEGEKRFNAGVGHLIGKRLAIVVDGKVSSAPVLSSTSSGREMRIGGNYTEKEARGLAAGLTGKSQ